MSDLNNENCTLREENHRLREENRLLSDPTRKVVRQMEESAEFWRRRYIAVLTWQNMEDTGRTPEAGRPICGQRGSERAAGTCTEKET